MLSLRELRRAAVALERLAVGHRLDRILQPDATSVVLCLSESDVRHGERAHLCILLSCRDQLGRVSELASPPVASKPAPPFCAFLKARLGRARLSGVRILGRDRQLALRFDAQDGSFDLVLSLLGRRSNLYLLDPGGALARTLRPLSQTRQELALGEPWRDPASPVEDEGDDRWPETPDEDYLSAVESSYRSMEAERATANLVRRLGTALRRETKSAARRHARLEAELAESEQATVLERQGQLLKSVLGRIQPGATEVTARDYESGEEVVIPLDRDKTPKQNLDATFKRYQKLLRRITKAGGQIELARSRCEELRLLGEELESIAVRGDAASAELEAFAARPDVAPLLAKHAPAEKRRGPAPARKEGERIGRFKDVPRRLHPNRYLSRDGLEIWVGRNDDGNDFLTTRLARGNDLFFHLDGAPGSHVVLRTGGRGDPPQESVLDACELAVHFSKARKAANAEVHVVPIKQVSKPRGAKPGLVWVTGGRSVRLRRESARLDRVLGSRVEE